jgi:hypothetical protein
MFLVKSTSTGMQPNSRDGSNIIQGCNMGRPHCLVHLIAHMLVESVAKYRLPSLLSLIWKHQRCSKWLRICVRIYDPLVSLHFSTSALVSPTILHRLISFAFHCRHFSVRFYFEVVECLTYPHKMRTRPNCQMSGHELCLLLQLDSYIWY